MTTQCFVPDTTARCVGLELKGVYKFFGEKTIAVRNCFFTIQPGELCCLLGPSGCGKSTMLRLIAGLERPDRGTICIDGKDMAGVPPQQRNVGMVFQNYALFPHMNVFENIAYGITHRASSAASIHNNVERVLSMVRLPGYNLRRINDLSGGEQQRVALARSLVTNPRLLLLDEPFSNLDARLRDVMRDELRTLQRSLGITTILVTHDQEEAMMLADTIVLMRDGAIEQSGSPKELYISPSSSFAANFLGRVNLFEPEVFLQLFQPTETGWTTGRIQYMAVRPEAIHLVSPENGTHARVHDVFYHGAYLRYRLEYSSPTTGPVTFTAECPAEISCFSAGEQVGVRISPDSVMPLAK